jgi:dTDP-4-dehydrorhamnose reductase
MKHLKVLVTGATGLLGGHLTSFLSDRVECHPTGYRLTLEDDRFFQLDLSDGSAVDAALQGICPDVIIHCAALTNVDGCEAEPDLAYRLNVQATGNIATWCRQQAPGKQLIYVSSDQMYQGAGPHVEADVAPLNRYAQTKLWGETVVREVERHLILRTNFFGYYAGQETGLVAFFIDAFENGTPITLFEDVLFNPLYVADWPEIIWPLVDGDISGTFNLGAAGKGISKAEFAFQIAKALDLDASLATIGSVDDAPMKARRPNDMRMDVSKIQASLDRPLPTVEQGLNHLAADLGLPKGPSRWRWASHERAGKHIDRGGPSRR